jgi:hypothetical protein
VKSFWRWTGTIFFALAFLFLVLTGIGTSLPIDHLAACSTTFYGAPKYLFATVENDGTSIRWRPDIASAVLVSGSGPTAVWRETDSHGNATTYRTTRYIDGRFLARTIDYVPGMPFAGTWAFSFFSAPNKTTGGKRSSTTSIHHRTTFAALPPFLTAYGPPGTTRVTIMEDGKVYNPFFRFLSRYVFGYAQSMRAYLRDLGTDLGQTPPVSCATDL